MPYRSRSLVLEDALLIEFLITQMALSVLKLIQGTRTPTVFWSGRDSALYKFNKMATLSGSMKALVIL